MKRKTMYSLTLSTEVGRTISNLLFKVENDDIEMAPPEAINLNFDGF